MQEPSDNLVIYGHHMSNGSMFAHLEKFKSKDFWSEHRMITFNTLTDKQRICSHRGSLASRKADTNPWQKQDIELQLPGIFGVLLERLSRERSLLLPILQHYSASST